MRLLVGAPLDHTAFLFPTMFGELSPVGESAVSDADDPARTQRPRMPGSRRRFNGSSVALPGLFEAVGVVWPQGLSLWSSPGGRSGGWPEAVPPATVRRRWAQPRVTGIFRVSVCSSDPFTGARTSSTPSL